MLAVYLHKNTEIVYSYNFRTLPIENKDILVLNEKMEEMVEDITKYLQICFQKEIILPEILVSEDIIKDEYGKYSIEEIMQIFERGRELIKNYPETEMIAEQLNRCRELLQEIAAWEYDDMDCSQLYDGLNHQIDDLKQQLASLDEDIRIVVEKVINSVKGMKKTKIRLCDYDYGKNRINLYIKAIDGVFSKYPNGNRRDNILAGLQIVLAHEVFHAVHFHFMDERVITQKVRNENKRKSVLEGLARWFEYFWCSERQFYFNDGIYEWWMNKLEAEYKTGYHPNDPYAASEVFLKHGVWNSPYFANKVFNESLQYREHHWYLTYKFMCGI